jgi:hypothetical protein
LKVEPGSLLAKVKFASVAVVGSSGPELIEVIGAVVSPTGVFVGAGVAVGGTGVLVGVWVGVAVGGIGVLVGAGPAEV